VDAQKVGGIVQRGEIGTEGDLVKDVRGDDGTAGEEVSALNDAVAHCLDVLERLQDAGLLVRKGGKDKLHTYAVVRNGDIRYNFFTASRGILKHTCGKADLFCNTFGDDIEYIVALHIKQLILDGGASTIDNEDNHILKLVNIFVYILANIAINYVIS
jgi:hypothetical protein